MKNLFAIVFMILFHQVLVGQSSLIRDLNVQADFQPSTICLNQPALCTVNILNNNWTGGTGSKDTLYAGSVAVQLKWSNRTHALNIVPTGGTLASKFTWTYYPTGTGGYSHGGWYGLNSQNIVVHSGSIAFHTSGQHQDNNVHGAQVNLLVLAPFLDNNTNNNTIEPLITILHTCNLTLTCNNIVTYNISSGELTTTTVFNSVNSDSSVAGYYLSQNTWTCMDIGTVTFTTLTVTDTAGNVSSCTAHVTLSDSVTPLVTCTAVMHYNVGGMELVTATAHSHISDNCTVTPATFLSQTGGWGCADKGNHTITLTVDDGNGNVTSCTVLVMVSDTTEPNLNCNSSVTYDINGSPLTTTAVMVSATDNCGIGDYTLSKNTWTCTDFGTVTFTTLTVTDTSGNVTKCTVQVAVMSTTGTVTTTASACDSYTWSANGQTFSVSGTYTSVSGCTTNVLVLSIITFYAGNVTIDYSGASFLTTTNNVAQFPLSAVITLPVGTDVTKSELRFINRDNGLPISGWLAIGAGSQPNKGSASYQHTLKLGLNELYRQYNIGFELGGINSCFSRNNAADDVAVKLAKPSCGCH
jgi:hypothetical protein